MTWLSPNSKLIWVRTVATGWFRLALSQSSNHTDLPRHRQPLWVYGDVLFRQRAVSPHSHNTMERKNAYSSFRSFYLCTFASNKSCLTEIHHTSQNLWLFPSHYLVLWEILISSSFLIYSYFNIVFFTKFGIESGENISYRLCAWQKEVIENGNKQILPYIPKWTDGRPSRREILPRFGGKSILDLRKRTIFWL